MSRMTNEQVCHVFAHHQAGDSNNLHSDGVTLKSYSTPIATWIEGVCFVSSNTFSITTASKHLSPLHRAISYKGFSTPAFRHGAWSAPSAAECIIAAAEEMQTSFNKILRMRTYVTESINAYETRRNEILSMAARFQVQELPEMPEVTGDLKEKAKELAAKEREKRVEEQRRKEERERAQRIIDQGELDLWLQQGRGWYPHSFRKHGADQITIKQGFSDCGHLQGMPTRNPNPDTVITSQGAEAPLDHVIKALKFYDSRHYTERDTNGIGGSSRYTDRWITYHTNGHKIHLGVFVLDSIDEAGNVKAGCHTFSAAEIARFRKQWGL